MGERERQACWRPFSEAGRMARMVYSAARELSRWFWEGSERVRVQRVRMRRDLGVGNGRGAGMGEVCGGTID